MLARLENISKDYGSQSILREVDIAVSDNDKIAVIGPNGCGKTTLINIIAGITEPDSGTVEHSRKLQLSILRQIDIPLSDTGILDYVKDETGFSDEDMKNIETDVYVDREMFNAETKIEKVLSGLGFSEGNYSQPVKSLSKGQFRRISFAVALLKESNMLILDEPTNHMDVASIEWLEKYLSSLKKAVLFVSHDKSFIDRIAQKVLYIYDRRVHAFSGNYSSFRTQWENIRINALRRNDKLLKERIKLEDFIRKNIAGQKTKQAQSRQKQLSRLEERELIKDDSGVFFKFHNVQYIPPVVSYFRSVSCGYGDEILFSGASFSIHKNDRIGIIGNNGAGKTTMLDLILGKTLPRSGEVFLNKNIDYFYLSQESYSIFDNLRLRESLEHYAPSFTKQQIMDILGAYKLADMSETEFSRLSGGEKRRFQLSITQIAPFHLLVLDEPTNHLDIFSIENLIEGLENYNGCCIFVTHDRYFLERIADRIIEIENKRVTFYYGNYSYYRYKKGTAGSIEIDCEKSPSKKKDKASASRQRKSLSKNQFHQLKIRQEEIERLIEDYEEERENLISMEFSNPENYRDKDQYLKMKRRLDHIENRIEDLLGSLEEILMLLEK